MKYVFTDVEPTGDGTNVNHAILELTLEIWEKLKDGRLVFRDVYTEHIRPEAWAVYQELRPGIFANLRKAKALHEREELIKTDKEVFEDMVEWLNRYINPYDKEDKSMFVAFNSEFDLRHLKNMFVRNGSNYFYSYFSHTPICVLNLANVVKPLDMAMSSNSLGNYCKHFNITWRSKFAHSSSYDTMKMRELFVIVMNEIGKTYEADKLEIYSHKGHNIPTDDDFIDYDPVFKP